MARKQEQEAASEEVVEVAPGVLRMQLPIRIPGLRHVNCYALLDDAGVALVDPGLPGPATWRALRHRLRQAGLEPRHVHTVVVTHSHPDHFGGASRVVRECGARVVAHRSFSFGGIGRVVQEPEVSVDDLPAPEDLALEVGSADRHFVADDPEVPTLAGEPAPWDGWLGRTPWGGRRMRPPLWKSALWAASRLALRLPLVPKITEPVRDGDRLSLAGREWRVLHTPGHTGDHVCFYDADGGVLIAGDHVLPTITPHVSGLVADRDPLRLFLESLDRIGGLPGVRQVLPAHGHPFTDLRARTDAISRHHAERLECMRAIGREIGPATVAEFSRQLFAPRSWGPMAESETYAHLEHLRLAGSAERRCERDGPMIYVTG
jgi:glyoxylase-like metal-dependent hydrolase (beta-lactamase superfamily II)